MTESCDLFLVLVFLLPGMWAFFGCSIMGLSYCSGSFDLMICTIRAFPCLNKIYT